MDSPETHQKQNNNRNKDRSKYSKENKNSSISRKGDNCFLGFFHDVVFVDYLEIEKINGKYCSIIESIE